MLIFTDGSHSLRPRMSGFGAVIITKDKEIPFGTYSNKCKDNNIAEVAAIAMALQYIKDHKILDKTSDRTITIISDSEFALRKINQRSSIPDQFGNDCLNYILDFVDNTNKVVNLMQVKGHVHDGTKMSHYNNMADVIAGEYRRMGLELEHEKMKEHMSYKQFLKFKNQNVK